MSRTLFAAPDPRELTARYRAWSDRRRAVGIERPDPLTKGTPVYIGIGTLILIIILLILIF